MIYFCENLNFLFFFYRDIFFKEVDLVGFVCLFGIFLENIFLSKYIIFIKCI